MKNRGSDDDDPADAPVVVAAASGDAALDDFYKDLESIETPVEKPSLASPASAATNHAPPPLMVVTSDNLPPPPPRRPPSTPFSFPPLPETLDLPSVPKRNPGLVQRHQNIRLRLDRLRALPATLRPEHAQLVNARCTELKIRAEDWFRGVLATPFFESLIGHWEANLARVEELYAPNGWTITWDAESLSFVFTGANGERLNAWPPADQILPDLPTDSPPISNSATLEALAFASPEIAVATVTPEEPAPEPQSATSDRLEEKEKPAPKKRKSTKPESVSVSAKSRKMANMLVKWRTAVEELAEDEDEESDEGGVQKWRETAEERNASNPNFAPLGKVRGQ
ncbi:hypothetical protein HK101_010434 [Irineochytrium annulatum]|nr:hypothetical protein HK101_010434 [Irineochytrium annulatum]